MIRRLALVLAALLGSLLATPSGFAAPPVVPASLPYQGLLLDGLGEPRSGSVDLTLRIYDALVGGTLVYKQSFPSVALTDGVFNVQLGPTGESSDAPANPLTSDLATALAGDAGATSPVRFLQITVGGDGPIARTQILASAYALRATSAATADSATTAQNATSVGGFDSGYVTQFFTHFAADGGDPPNTDPREGIGDLDGDGLANFLDSDNDADGVADSTELIEGADINLITPRALAVEPDLALFADTSTVTVQGSGFQPGLAVVFGSETPTPTNLTATSFDVTVGPQDPGLATVTVTNTNGESSLADDLFEFAAWYLHAVTLGPRQTSLALRQGAGPPATALGGVKQYGVGAAAELSFPLASRGASGQIAMAWSATGALAGLRCRDFTTFCSMDILIDRDGDFALEEENATAIPVDLLNSGSNPTILAADLIRDPTGRWLAGYVRRASSVQAAVAHDRNGDNDFADANEVVALETITASSPVAADVAADPSGRAAYAYVAGTNIRFGWDRNGDGDFADVIGGNPEVATLSTLGSTCVGATFDGAGHPAVVYSTPASVSLARDLNDDGDFADAGETVSVAAANAQGCDVAYESGQPLAVAYASGPVHVLLDQNGDGDFTDPNENTTIAQNGGAELEMALDGVDRAVIAVNGFLLVRQTD